MKTLEEFQSALASSLQKLEDFRLNELQAASSTQWYYIFPALITIVALIIYWTINPVMAFVVFSLAVALGVYIIEMTNQRKQNYGDSFKKKILTTLVKVFYKKTSYNAQRKISKKSFLKSELYVGVLEYEGGDLFKGKTEQGFRFQFCELDVALQALTRTQPTSFKGFFFEIESPHQFPAKVLVHPNSNKTVPNVGQELEQLSLQGLTADGELVAVANVYPKFEKDFTVYSHSKEMAYHVLTPAIVEGLYTIKEQWGVTPLISFIENKIYIAIPSKKNFFQASIHDSLLDPAPIEQLYQELSHCIAVIEHLGLVIAKITLEENPPAPSDTDTDDTTADLDLPIEEDLE